MASMHRRTARLLVLLLATTLAVPSILLADARQEVPIDYSRTVVLFYGERCPHCHTAINYLESVVADYPLLTFVRIEVEQTTNPANRAYFREVMERLDSQASGYPRLVVGDRVFAGFTESNGPLQWMESHRAYAGFQNQIHAALEEVHARVAASGGVAGGPTDGAAGGVLGDSADTTARERAGAAPDQVTIEPIRPRSHGAGPAQELGSTVGRRSAVVAAILVVYVAVAFAVIRRRGSAARQHTRLWIGGGGLLAILGLFVIVAGATEGALAGSVTGLPFPLLVTAIALLDGFNPCAFTVLFILLSLLTYARRRRHMVAVGGVFLIASAAIYVAFIFAIIAVGSFALANLGSWILRVIGAAVLIMGGFGMYETLRSGSGSGSMVTSLSDADKAGLSRRAASVVRRFTEAQTPAARLTALGATAVLAVVVNSVEFGCTAILPAVYMSSLVSSFGPRIGAAHVGWTLWYGVVYVLPMAAILANFVITFRSERMSAIQGRRLKLAGSVVMVGLGGVLAVAPGLLTF